MGGVYVIITTPSTAMAADSVEDWRGYFTFLTGFLNECKQQWETKDAAKIPYICERLECSVRSTQRLQTSITVTITLRLPNVTVLVYTYAKPFVLP